MLAFFFGTRALLSLFDKDVSLVVCTGSPNDDLVPLVLGTSYLAGSFSGSGTYLPFTLHEVF